VFRVGLVVAGLAGCGERRELREWTPDDHTQPESVSGQVAPTNSMTDAERVALLWVEECASCHGEGGRGDGPSRPADAPVRDLTAQDWQGTVTDEQIAEIIRNGRGQMPAYDQRINDIGIAALVQHIRSLDGS
jgi:mono/diheme cytochrome c family protein